MKKENQTKEAHFDVGIIDQIHRDFPFSQDHNALDDFSKAKHETDNKICIEKVAAISIINEDDTPKAANQGDERKAHVM